MRPLQFHADSLVVLLRKKRIATIEQLKAALGTSVDMTVFRKLREDFEIGLGCIDVTPGKIDSVDDVVGRVHTACEHLDKERITLNPDCCFAPGSGAAVDMDEVYRKLCVETRAAAILREHYG